MSQTIIDQHGNSVSSTVGERKIDAGRGANDGTVSRQWFNRPDDQRFNSIDELIAHLEMRTHGMRQDVIAPHDIKLHAEPTNPEDLWLVGPEGRMLAPTNIAFTQMCGLGGAPAAYLRGKPAMLTALNLMDDLRSKRDLSQLAYWNENSGEMRAFTGEKYGRITDLSVAMAVRNIVGNGQGDTCWKVPGVMDWSTMKYNPYVDVTKQTTTLFGSDRDVFMFYVDDTHPIEIGKLADGSPDYIFRGFYVWNSEVGTRSLGLSTFWLRGVCQNRNLWGVENMESMTLRHSLFAPDRFAREMQPALKRYAESSGSAVLAGINAAREVPMERDPSELRGFLMDKRNGDFTKNMAELIQATHEREEQRPIENLWDVVNGITAVARSMPNQDGRIDMEKKAAKLMDRATRAPRKR